jgi:hypothetical protein
MRYRNTVILAGTVIVIGIVAALVVFRAEPGPPPIPSDPADQVKFLANDGTVLIADADIVSYTWASHMMTLRSGKQRELRKDHLGTLVSGVPFTLSVDGEALYTGTMTTIVSSFSFRTPVLVIDGCWPDLKEDQVCIQLGFPSDKFFAGDDPRDDPRLRAALQSSGRLFEATPHF